MIISHAVTLFDGPVTVTATHCVAGEREMTEPFSLLAHLSWYQHEFRIGIETYYSLRYSHSGSNSLRAALIPAVKVSFSPSVVL